MLKKVKVIEIKHWNKKLFSFKVERPEGFNFKNGHFVMIGLNINNINIMRAYSIVSTNYDNYLEFLSVVVEEGLLTSNLKNIKVNDTILLNTKSTGSLVADNLKNGENLYLLSTGTGIAPFMSIIRDPYIYEKFNNIYLLHSVRYVKDLAYNFYLNFDIYKDEYLGHLIKNQFNYVPIVTREGFKNQKRITDLISTNNNILKPISVKNDKVMICGNPNMLKDSIKILENKGFIHGNNGYQGDFVIERAFVEK